MARVIIPISRPSIMLLSRLCAETLLHLDALGRSRQTIAAYDVGFRQFTAYVVSVLALTDDARHLTSDRVLGFMLHMRQHGANPNTIRARLSAIKALYQYGARIKDGRGRPVVAADPLVGLERPKRRKPPERFLLPHEFRAFLEVPCPPRVSIVRDVLVDTGLRVAELCAADVGDLFTIDGRTTLQVTVKGGETTQVPISATVADGLRDYLLSRNMPDPGEPLFVNTQSARYQRTAMAGLIVRLGRAAGIARLPQVGPHTIRHTLEVIRRRSKIDPSVRSRLLTHSSYASLVSYQHVLGEELAEARDVQVAGVLRYIGLDMPSPIIGQPGHNQTTPKGPSMQPSADGLS